MPGFTFETQMRAMQYAAGAQAALHMDLIPSQYLTTTCPECGDEVTNDITAHVVIIDREETQFVIVGCEGYWVINPEIIGMDREGWSDWTAGDEMDRVTGVHDASCNGDCIIDHR